MSIASVFHAVPDHLQSAVWRGDRCGRSIDRAQPTGFTVLDEQLPGGGWPHRVLTELLLPHPGIGEIRLLVPCLASIQSAGRSVMLFDPPQPLSAQALDQLGIDAQQLLVVHTRARVIPGSDSLWALEQALKSGHVGAVIGWLPPRLRTDRLRRLQVAAQAHDGPAFVFRERAVQDRPTAAPLRLGLQPAGADRLHVRLLKRRGPPLEASLVVPLRPVLSEGLRAAAGRRRLALPSMAPKIEPRQPVASASVVMPTVLTTGSP